MTELSVRAQCRQRIVQAANRHIRHSMHNRGVFGYRLLSMRQLNQAVRVVRHNRIPIPEIVSIGACLPGGVVL